MGLIRSVANWAKALGYLLTGRLDAAREVLDTNPHVMQAKFDEIIRDKVGRIHQYRKAVAALMAQQEKKIQQLQELTGEVDKLESLRAGAAAKARKTAEAMQRAGKTPEEVRQNEDYKKCLAAYNDFSSTLQEKQARIAELEATVGEYQKSVGEHKVQMQQLLRDLDKLKAEAAATVADMITAREEKEIGDMLAGIAKDGMSQELQRMRDLRQKVKAEVKITKTMAGMDTRAQEAEFLEYARTSASNDEFDKLIGIAAEAASAETQSKTSGVKLPE